MSPTALLDQSRYYFPNLAQGSIDGQVPAEVLLTLRTGGGNPIGSNQQSELQDNRGCVFVISPS